MPNINLHIMLPEQKRKQIIDLMNREVVPAMGCTEPIAVALCAAKCAEVLGKTPDRIVLYLSANILKNAMGVGIPGTGMIGLPIAIALGLTIGKSDYNLEVIRDVNPQAVEAGKIENALPFTGRDGARHIRGMNDGDESTNLSSLKEF